MRLDMEEDIRQNRFLEYGEYAENLYGTTFDAIRTTNKSGKMCVLDINPQVGIIQGTFLNPQLGLRLGLCTLRMQWICSEYESVFRLLHCGSSVYFAYDSLNISRLSLELEP